MVILIMALGMSQAVQAQVHSLNGVHPGMLHTAADFAHITAEVNAGAQPWLAGWNKLLANPHSSSTYVMAGPVVTIVRGTAADGAPQNYMDACQDAAAAYQNALRWKIAGTTANADEAIKILNAWASTCTGFDGDDNQFLASGLQGYQWANAAEIMRGYSGWSATDFSTFQTWMANVYYKEAHTFMTNPVGCPAHFWENWELSNMATIESIGILNGNNSYFAEGVNYYCHNNSPSINGFIGNIVTKVYSGGLDQSQESGRDIGHATLDVALIGPFCLMAGNSGTDMFDYNPWSEDVTRPSGMSEYVGAVNMGDNSVPYTAYIDSCDKTDQTVLATGNVVRPIWALIQREWPSLTYVARNASAVSPEGGGGDYGTTSGSYDSLGFGTLMFTK